MLIPGQIENWTMIIDFKNIGVTSLQFSVRLFLKKKENKRDSKMGMHPFRNDNQKLQRLLGEYELGYKKILRYFQIIHR